MAKAIRLGLAGLFALFVAALTIVKYDRITPAADVRAPKAPRELQATLQDDTSIALTWMPPLEESRRLYYRVQRCQVSSTSCQFKRINRGSLTTTSYLDTNLDEGTYRYRVFAARQANRRFHQGPASSVIQVTIGANAASSDTETEDTPPAVASNLPEPTLFIAEDGSDARSCRTKNEACRTIEAAIKKVRPNQSEHIVFTPGNYPGFILADIGLTRSDAETKSHPLIISAEEDVIIGKTNRLGINIIIERSKGITLHGFIIDKNGNETANRNDENAIRVLDSSYITLEDNELAECPGACILTARSNKVTIQNNIAHGSPNSHGIYLSESGDDLVVRNNKSYGNARSGIQINAEQAKATTSPQSDGLSQRVAVIANEVYDNAGNGLNLLGVQQATVANNLIYNNQLIGIALAKVAAKAGPRNVLVAYNTIHGPAAARQALQIIDAAGMNSVRNNIIAHDGGKLIDYDSGVDSKYNVYIGGNQDEAQSVIASTLPEVFIDAASHNYRLTATSLAKGRALPLTAVQNDITGTARPQPQSTQPDIGAYESN